MKKKLILTYLILVTLIVSITLFLSYQQSFKLYSERMHDNLIKQAILISDLLENNSDKSIDDLLKNYTKQINARITLVNMSGKVICDSVEDINIMDNHKYREEIHQALDENVGYSIRFSSTAKINYLYSAIKVDSDVFTGVIRLSVPFNELKKLGMQFIKYTITVLSIGLFLAIIIYYLYVNKITKPLDELTTAAIKISKGKYDIKLNKYSDYQLSKLSEAYKYTLHDINEKIKQTLYRNNELEAILGSMINGIIAVNNNYDIILKNDSSVNLLELKNNNIVGKNIIDIFRNKNIFDILEQVFIKDIMIQKKIEYNNKTLMIYANPIKSDNKVKVVGVVLLINDVTKLSKLENMRKDFVSNVTHELRTPLTSIRGFIDTLKNGAINDEKVSMKFLNIIDLEAKRLNSLISDLLKLSEIENLNDNDLIMENNNFQNIIEEVKWLFTEKAKQKNIEFVVNNKYKGLNLICNKDSIKQLLINLIDNSIKYTDVGFVKIEIDKFEKDVVISVIDTGIGIGQEHISRVFERFYRVDKGRSRKTGGTGLGLSIVKHIVELYNGDIFIDSQVGKGTTITIKLYNVVS